MASCDTTLPDDKSKTNHVISWSPPVHAPSLGSLRQCVLIVSPAELIVSDGELVCFGIPSIFYITYIISLNLF